MNNNLKSRVVNLQ